MKKYCNISTNIFFKCILLLFGLSEGSTLGSWEGGQLHEEVQADPGTLTLLFRCLCPELSPSP